MKVYNVGVSPITYTGASRKLYTTAAQQLEPVAAKGREILDELAQEALFAARKDDDVLNYLYKHLPVGSERKLENFNGERKISVYRGENFMNKITQRLSIDQPPVIFVRSMENIGTNENPKLRTTSVCLRREGKIGDMIKIDFLQDPKKLFLTVLRDGYEAHRAIYTDWHELNKDSVFIRIVKNITGKDIF